MWRKMGRRQWKASFHFPVDRWRIPLRLVEPHVFVGLRARLFKRGGLAGCSSSGALLLPMLING